MEQGLHDNHNYITITVLLICYSKTKCGFKILLIMSLFNLFSNIYFCTTQNIILHEHFNINK